MLKIHVLIAWYVLNINLAFHPWYIFLSCCNAYLTTSILKRVIFIQISSLWSNYSTKIYETSYISNSKHSNKNDTWNLLGIFFCNAEFNAHFLVVWKNGVFCDFLKIYSTEYGFIFRGNYKGLMHTKSEVSSLVYFFELF